MPQLCGLPKNSKNLGFFSNSPLACKKRACASEKAHPDDFTLRARAGKKSFFFFFPLTGVNDGGIFSGGWSPHMDYPVARWWDEFGCPLRVIQIGI